MDKREQIIEALEISYRYSNVDENNTLVPQEIVLDIIALLKAQEPRVTCSVCKYSRCLSGEWFCFMIGTSRYGKRVTGGDWYCKDAIRR